MKVICKGHETCEFRYNCSHAKLHDIKIDGIDNSVDCTLLTDKDIYTSLPASCFCDTIYARKIKLKTLNESNL